MITVPKYLVITASDISSKKYLNSNAQNFEQDCACPSDDFQLSSGIPLTSKVDQSLVHSDVRPYFLPILHIGHLRDEFSLVFNSLSQTGVVVLNQHMLSLLRGFQSPKTLDEGIAASDYPKEVTPMIHRMAYLKLLQPIGSQIQLTHSKPKTLTAWLHVTNECNLRCPYCYVHKTPDDMSIEHGRQAVDAIFRSAIANGFRGIKIKYAGGEATLNFHTVLILHDYARQLADQYGLTLDSVVLSNGVAISDRMIEEMKLRGIRLMISLDGIGRYQDSHRPFVNGHGSFDHVERGLDRLAARNFVPSISITVSNRNLKGLPEVVEYVLNRSLPFTINFFRENECSTSFADLHYQDDAIIAAMKEAFSVIEGNLPSHSLLGALVDRAQLESPHDRPCGVGNSYLVINHNGGVSKCHMELEQPITDITVADPLQVIRNDLIGLQNLPVDEKEGCRECHWRYWCAGGCPALTHRVTGRFDVKSPNCHVYKAIFPEVLRLEGLRLLQYGLNS